jgi:hypothetical protein
VAHRADAVDDVVLLVLHEVSALAHVVVDPSTVASSREGRFVRPVLEDLQRRFCTTITQSTLLLIGKETARKYVDVMRFLGEKLPSTTLVEIPDQGNFAHVAVADTVSLFLGGT